MKSERDSELTNTDFFWGGLRYLNRDRQNGFVFGTNPMGLEFDTQVNQEGQGGPPGLGGSPPVTQTAQPGSGGALNRAFVIKFRQEFRPC